VSLGTVAERHAAAQPLPAGPASPPANRTNLPVGPASPPVNKMHLRQQSPSPNYGRQPQLLLSSVPTDHREPLAWKNGWLKKIGALDGMRIQYYPVPWRLWDRLLHATVLALTPALPLAMVALALQVLQQQSPSRQCFLPPQRPPSELLQAQRPPGVAPLWILDQRNLAVGPQVASVPLCAHHSARQ